jgi:hypothetical protein
MGGDTMSVNNISITINRATGDVSTQSFNVWAKSGTYPTTDGDGMFVANITISTNASSVTYVWTPPSNGNWYLIATGVRFDVSSLPARLTL